MFKNFSSAFLSFIRYISHWAIMLIPVGIVIGATVALFLWLLNLATFYRFAHAWLLYLLPVGGIIIHLLYKFLGKSAERGNNLIIEEIHQPGGGVPKRMAPLILVTTIITHFFGGSAGREGTAVQIGGSIAHFFSSVFKLTDADKKTLLAAGMAAGFGAVFGTPFTGAVFAIEVLTVGRLNYKAFVPCLVASFVGDATVAAIGVHHTAYHIKIIAHSPKENLFLADVILGLKVIICSSLFGLAARVFVLSAHYVKRLATAFIKPNWLMPVVGGFVIIGLTILLGKPDYLGLGVEPQYLGAVTIVSAFQHGGADALSWLWKIVYTDITLGTGFKGGEVTPLFYIGATLGNFLAQILNAPISLFAALGFIAVFSGATKTPLACTIMGIELFGPDYVLFFAVACSIAYLCSGKTGIYSAQRKADVHMLKAYYRKFRAKGDS
ncbi:chloride channel protein [Mucilaginibacter ginkgonis]|uniref:Chloride channel protein n=1 Tax=Mucilaginibacter ginkgonis TaxID=2682091 RepID=A0A6I4HZH9_9SPHI|nr:chloride channel protein [Mucilaginibacter ginkgonis]QQL48757.1 chloride channel protein [Mucilaginibacter ginkgonis]